MVIEAETAVRQGAAERERVVALLHGLEPELRSMGVTRLRLFGSIARGEADPGSDVDLIAEIDPRAGVSLLEVIRLEEDLALRIGRPVDISTAPWKMRERLRERIAKEAVEVF